MLSIVNLSAEVDSNFLSRGKEGLPEAVTLRKPTLSHFLSREDFVFPLVNMARLKVAQLLLTGIVQP